MSQKEINQLSYGIVGCAIEVHKHLGPGLLESIYEECMIHELRSKDFDVKNQVLVPVIYKGLEIRQSLRLDILINDAIIVELKALEGILPVHKAQLLSYMKLAQKPKGLLINFFTDNITKSVIPLVNEYFSLLPPT